LPWFHNVLLIEKVKSAKERIWYAHKTVEHGWSRAILDHQIDTDLYRQSKAVSNFQQTLPVPKSELAQQTLKDPYSFDFPTLADDAQERNLDSVVVSCCKNTARRLHGSGRGRLGIHYAIHVTKSWRVGNSPQRP
jgi:predicted nuclease of restriction endonuclease-like (RecB) superfamily